MTVAFYQSAGVHFTNKVRHTGAQRDREKERESERELERESERARERERE